MFQKSKNEKAKIADDMYENVETGCAMSAETQIVVSEELERKVESLERNLATFFHELKTRLEEIRANIKQNFCPTFFSNTTVRQQSLFVKK